MHIGTIVFLVPTHGSFLAAALIQTGGKGATTTVAAAIAYNPKGGPVWIKAALLFVVLDGNVGQRRVERLSRPTCGWGAAGSGTGPYEIEKSASQV